MQCPECGSSNLIRFGRKFVWGKGTGKRVRVQQYQCKGCGRITIRPLKDKGE